MSVWGTGRKGWKSVPNIFISVAAARATLGVRRRGSSLALGTQRDVSHPPFGVRFWCQFDYLLLLLHHLSPILSPPVLSSPTVLPLFLSGGGDILSFHPPPSFYLSLLLSRDWSNSIEDLVYLPFRSLPSLGRSVGPQLVLPPPSPPTKGGGGGGSFNRFVRTFGEGEERGRQFQGIQPPWRAAKSGGDSPRFLAENLFLQGKFSNIGKSPRKAPNPQPLRNHLE